MNELETTRHYLRDKPVFRACTFGPYARGEADAQSDLDLLLELDYSQPIGWQFVGMKLDLETQLKKSVDLVSENGLPPPDSGLLLNRINSLSMNKRFGNK